MDKVFCLCGRAVMKKVFVACALGFLFGCGAKNEAADDTTSADAIKTPATVEQAAKVLDLSTFPLMDGAKSAESRHVANLSYVAPGDPKKALEFHRKAFGAQGWKELPNSTISDQSASAMFARDGFVVSLSVIPFEATGVSVRLQNLGNVKPGKLPVPPNAKPVYVGEPTAMYSTDAAVPATADAIRNLFVAQGWVPYGKAGDSDFFKQNAILATATVSSAPAQGGKTMIQYSNQLISSDIPAPPDVEDLRYVDEPPELTFATTNQDAIVDFYRKTLAAAGWKSTMDKMVDVDEKPTMIFRNPAKEMITLAVPYDYGSGKLGVSVRFQSATEIAERDRKMKEDGSQAPRRSRSESSEGGEGGGRVGRKKQAAEGRRHAARGCKGREADQRLDQVHPRQGESQSGHRIVAQTVSRCGLERRGRVDGSHGRHALFLKRRRGECHVTYSDTGFMPTEISLRLFARNWKRRGKAEVRVGCRMSDRGRQRKLRE